VFVASLFVFKLGLILGFVERSDAQDIPIPQRLHAAINAVQRNARVVTRNDVDWKSCAPPEQDQIIKADLNGDGRLDYAALLLVRKKPIAKGERDGTAGAVWLVAFLGRPDGSYKPVVLDRHGDTESTGLLDIAITLRAPGVVKEVRSGRQITLTLPAIERVWCERSSTVFFWNRKAARFESVWTGD